MVAMQSITPTSLLNDAVRKANERIQDEQRFVDDQFKYQVNASFGDCDDPNIQAKSPMYLSLTYPNVDNREAKPIGATHIVKLIGDDWDNKKWEEVARNVNEVADSILKVIEWYFLAEADPNTIITERGVPFYPNDCNVTIDKNGNFKINEKIVTYNGSPVFAKQLVAEGPLEFIKRDKGHYEIRDKYEIDWRTGKKMFVDENKRIYRG